MIIYTHSITARLQYVVDFISNYFKYPITLTSSTDRYLEATTVKLNYSHEHMADDELYIHPHSLLFETGRRQVIADCFTRNGYTAFFRSDSTFGFDLFAATFFLLTRYEEYGPHTKDIYGRYDHTNSLAYKQGFLDQPLINIWLEEFGSILQTKGAVIKRDNTTFIPTYDIDIAWSYLNKGFKRTAGGFIRDALKGNWSYIRMRRQVLKKKESDPFDTYAWLYELHERRSLDPVYFFPLAQATGKYDKNTDPRHPQYILLIKEHTARYKIGLHPSWQSGDKSYLLTSELTTLQQITGQPVIRSRQHFIRFTLPDTYRRLLALGIKQDYSMGYGSINGFRASVCTPYFWYDLEKDEKTDLLLYPFCFMDANAYFEQKQTPQEALSTAYKYYQQVNKVKGVFITIWHTPFLGTDPQFEGWKEVYEQLIEKITGYES